MDTDDRPVPGAEQIDSICEGSFYTAMGSPPGSTGSSKASLIQAKNFKTYKEKINKKLSDLDKDESKYHSDLLKEEVKLVERMLSDLRIDSIIAQADKEPDFLGLFGDTEDSSLSR